MFQKAFEIACGFTRPVVMSRLTLARECSAGIGTFVIVNKDGWFLTAHHIIAQIHKLGTEEAAARQYDASAVQIREDISLSNKDKDRALSRLGKRDKDGTIRSSVWWGSNDLIVKAGEFHCNPLADIALGQFENFDPATAGNFPKFKDPSKGMMPGKSLCKLGFPLHEIVPTYDEAKNSFGFAAPLPIFPIEGIFTRNVLVQNKDKTATAKMLETSTPGLRGQSGGPTFDERGTIWAIQSKTAHYALGFKSKDTPEQYLNVGLGTHSEEIIKLFETHKVDYEKSDY